MNTEDLRVIKTKENIRTAYLELLTHKEPAKITVTELAALARVGKGTFYLHYRDIYDLHDQLVTEIYEDALARVDYYELFFTDPEEFIRRFGSTLKERGEEEQLLIRSRDVLEAKDVLLSRLVERLYQAGHIERTLENQIRMDIVLNSMLYISRKYGAAEYAGGAVSDRILSDLIHSYWG